MEKGPNAKFSSSIHSPIAAKWLSEFAVLSHFNICKSTLHSWYKKEGLPKYKIKRVTFYKESDINKLIQRHRTVAVKNNPINKQPVYGKKHK